MNKLKKWFRIKLRGFLGVGDIESDFKDHETFNSIRFSDIEKDANETNSKVQHLRQLINNSSNDISYCRDSINVLHNTIENVVHIGTDVYKSNQGHSWAVVCVEGKMNLVKFIDLNRQDGRDVLYFLKRYEAGRHCIDTPYKEMFYNGLFKF